ncbi:aminopeptidase P family protein [Microbacteriaceae bacterium]|nr:aminopeptidase P family protein [Candidatus Saccharibacteria bacterium]
MNHFRNRKSLTHALEGGVLVVCAYDATQQSADMEASFLQESNFWWLTGIEEAGWKAVIDMSRQHTTLIRPQRSQANITFNGSISDEDILRVSEANDIINFDDFEPLLRRLARNHSVVRTVYNKRAEYEFVHNPAQLNLFNILDRIFTNTHDASKDIANIRAIKADDEQTAINKAVSLTTAAFKHVREKLPLLKYEYEIEAEFSYYFRKHGARHAYAPIVASGSNACTLHYGRNSQKVPARGMILIDIGARVDGYAADITRTFALNPTKRQAEVHAAVERAHKAIIKLLKPGLPFQQYDQSVNEIMKKEMLELGLLKDTNDDEAYRRYFPHAIGHGLGVDVHDSLGGSRLLQAGMVLTVEPGIYISEEGIGVRIEDDILITPTGHKNLSASLSTAL